MPRAQSVSVISTAVSALFFLFQSPISRADALFSQVGNSMAEWESKLKPSADVPRMKKATPAVKRQKPDTKRAVPATLAPRSPRLPWEEARFLLVADEKYLIRFEDEDGAARVTQVENGPITVSFSPSEIERFRQAVDAVTRYRNELRGRCSSVSTRGLADALERYLSGLGSFHRKALPLVADISEANDMMALVVNRSLLIDAPVLIHRYFQYKRQRFKETLEQFKTADERLIQNLVTIAKVLRVEISDAAWKRSYGVREAALESLSLWPREVIFKAANTLSDTREMPCVVRVDAVEPSLATTAEAVPASQPVQRLGE